MLRSVRAHARAWLFITAVALGTPQLVSAAEPGDDLVISVLTFGPGDHPFYKFGHNAIWVHDEHARYDRRDVVYNFGTFAFDSPWLIVDFLKGRLKYWLSAQSLRGTIAAYREENRTIDSQELALAPSARRDVANALAENAKDENKYYKYDYYRDNCSTRVRDVIDRATAGRVKAASNGPASMTWREHTLRLTADDIPVYLGLDIAMGDLIDQKTTVWGEMFLPEKVQEALRSVTLVDTDGRETKLIKRESRLLSADRKPERTRAPAWGVAMAAIGSAFGALLALLGWASARRRAARIAFAIALGAFGLVLGFFGWLFTGLWALTDHAVAYHNENILQCAPWAVVLAGLVVGMGRGRVRAIRLAYHLVLAAAAASLLGLVLKALPWFDQGNGQIIALLLPFWAGAFAGITFLRRATDSAAQTDAALPNATVQA